jgi:hypothetical protein
MIRGCGIGDPTGGRRLSGATTDSCVLQLAGNKHPGASVRPGLNSAQTGPGRRARCCGWLLLTTRNRQGERLPPLDPLATKHVRKTYAAVSSTFSGVFSTRVSQ